MVAVLSIVAAVVSALIVVGVRRYSERGALIDMPNERSSHTRPTPRGGGLAIVLVTLSGVLLWSCFHTAFLPTVLAYSVAAAGIATVSWIDDVRGLSNRIRFGTHLAGALLVVAVAGWIDTVFLPFVGLIPLGWVGVPLTILWLVGFTNAYNFMDGIDGLAGSQAVIAGVGWAVVGGLVNNPLLELIGILVAASSAGFLAHNRPPARIFMGDVGSAFLGFTLATLTIIGTRTSPDSLLVGILMVWPFVFDTAYTLFRRWRNGENIFSAHRSHLYQRLVIAGHSHMKVTLLYSGLSAIGLVLALFRHAQWSAVAFIGIGGAAVGLWYYVRAQERVRV